MNAVSVNGTITAMTILVFLFMPLEGGLTYASGEPLVFKEASDDDDAEDDDGIGVESVELSLPETLSTVLGVHAGPGGAVAAGFMPVHPESPR